jgi:hypothetical protein
MNFKRFNDIGDCEPRAWNRSAPGTRFAVDDDDDDDEIPVPYCDDFDDEESEEEQEHEDEVDTETETDSVASSGVPVKRMMKNISVVLQEESDFMKE